MNERVQEELRKYWNDTLLLQGHIDLILSPIHELHQEYNQLLLEYRKTVFEKGYDEGKRLVIRELKKNRFALKSEPVTIKKQSNELFGTIRETERMLEQDTFTATETTLSRVDKNINKILTDGYKEGKGIKEVSNRIQQRFNQLETWEANRIARTEIHSSHSLGRRQSYLDLDVEYVEWSSAHDKRVRGHKKTDLANHMIMDGEIKPINEKYSNGLLYPGDKSGRIEEWVNCRCSEAPVIMPPDKMAPVGQTQFREADMVNVAPVDTDSLLRRATGGKLGWSEFRKVLGGASVESVVRGATIEATREKPKQKPKTKLTFEELETPKQVADYYGLEYKPKQDKRGNIKSYNFKDKTHNCEIIIDKHYIKDENKLIDLTNSGKAKYNLKDVIRYYDESPSLLKHATNEITFVKSRAKRVAGRAYLVEYNQKKINISDLNKPAKDMKVVKTKFIKINPNAFKAGQTEKGNLRHVMLHEMSHCLDFSYISKEKANILLNPSKYTYAEVRKANKDIEYYYGISGIANRMGKPSTARADVKYQRENDLPVSPNASKYGGENSAENWAETGAMSSYYQIDDKSMGVIRVSDEEVIGWEEWIKRHPNKYEEAVNILKYGEPSKFTFR